MQALLQRVSSARVEVNQDVKGQINRGLCVFLGVEPHDDESLARKLAHKVMNYRIFPDDNKAMNQSVSDIQGQLLIISQFTLAANTQKGLRPSFSCACPPDRAEQLYECFVHACAPNLDTQTGVFGANMQVSLTNDGPVTFLLKL